MSPSEPVSYRQMEQVDLSSLFMRKYKHCGREISRPMWFYVSLSKIGHAVTKRLIIDHGGKVSAELGDKNTSKEICLVEPHAKASREGRPAYSVEYIQRCIDEKRLLNIEDFRIPPVGRTRKTPPKKHRLVPGREPPIENRADKLATPHVPPTKDSEVTDDIPCIGNLEQEDENNGRHAVNVELRTSLAQDETHHEEVGGARRKATNAEERREGSHNTPTKELTKQPDLAVTKKRRRSELVLEAEVNGTGSDPHEVSPQPDTGIPIKDSMDWSREEDNEITVLCMEAKQAYHRAGKDPSTLFTLLCWSAIEKAQLLPQGRTAKACLARAKELWKNGDTEAAETPKKVALAGNDEKRVRPSPPERGSPNTVENEIEQISDQREAPNGMTCLPTKPQTEQEEPDPLKNASRLETREYIFELVARIAKRGKVTKRRAFRALRDERGHWKRALRRVIRGKESSET